jgi:hypothetical protein
VISVDPVGVLVPLVVVVAPVALLEVDVALAPVKLVVAKDPPSPVVPDNTVEPVPVVLGIDTVVVCVAPVVPVIENETFIS